MTEQEQEQKLAGLVGLARRGGLLLVGVPQVERALRAGQARLVFLSNDGSMGQRKGVFGLCKKFDVPVDETRPGKVLAGWAGVDRVTALAITDANLAQAAAKLLTSPA